ncbi:hypothetical protein WISP_37259 [Willisornis vidua]|uniref:Uncharacterized protein n=1 Tax=Willisornis vidua TaxID=1566151 RepID=A0ABQ9DI41_9PASS|nr:hypothetical protein WISP_37259 [Willisornis vidua]
MGQEVGQEVCQEMGQEVGQEVCQEMGQEMGQEMCQEMGQEMGQARLCLWNSRGCGVLLIVSQALIAGMSRANSLQRMALQPRESQSCCLRLF